MLHAEFGPDHKLTRLLMGFDVMGFMQQLRRCTGREGFQVCRRAPQPHTRAFTHCWSMGAELPSLPPSCVVVV
jgi:hypothetical protein